MLPLILPVWHCHIVSHLLLFPIAVDLGGLGVGLPRSTRYAEDPLFNPPLVGVKRISDAAPVYFVRQSGTT